MQKVTELLNDLDNKITCLDELKVLAHSAANQLREEQEQFEKMIKSMEKFPVSDPASDIVEFNVGGTHFSTLKSTICKRIHKPPIEGEKTEEKEEFYPPNLLEVLASGIVDVKLDTKKSIFIDRNPKCFGKLLDYLRTVNTDEKFELPIGTEQELNELLHEAEFYQLYSLKDLNRRILVSSILNQCETLRLLKLCKFKKNSNWKLLYRAKRDGFGSKNFHEKCDSFAKTLTVIKTVEGWVFGGYTEAPWKSDGSWSQDSKAFIFSLSNKSQIPTKFNSVGIDSTYSNGMFGPKFGGGYDLYIADNSNVSTSSYSNLGFSYKHPSSSKYMFGSNDATSFLAGNLNFRVDEIEVFLRVESAENACC